MSIKSYGVNLTHNPSFLFLHGLDLHVNTVSMSSAEPSSHVPVSEFIILFCWCHAGDVSCGLRPRLDGV